MSIKCGSCSGRHEGVAEVKACYDDKGTSATWSAGFADQDSRESAAREQTSFARRHPPIHPDVEMARKTGRRLASSKQVSFLRSLLADRDIPGYKNAWVVGLEAELGNEDLEWGNDGDGDSGGLSPLTLSSYDAHKAITDLIKMPKRTMYTDSRQAKVNAAIQQDGMYRNPDSGEIYKVQWNRAGGDGRYLYASRLVVDQEPIVDPESGEIIQHGKRHFDFERGLIARLRPEWRMDVEEAKRFGALYGTCVYGHALTKEESIRKGIGPVCEEKYGYPV